MRRMLLVLALFGVGLAVLASGCGDSSDAQENTITKKQWVGLTQAWCNREAFAEERDMKKFALAHGLLFGGGEPWEQEVINEAIVYDYVRTKIERFKTFPVPKGDQKEIDAMVAAFEEGLEKTEANPALLAEARPGAKPLPEVWDKSYSTTAAYGPWLCGQP